MSHPPQPPPPDPPGWGPPQGPPPGPPTGPPPPGWGPPPGPPGPPYGARPKRNVGLVVGLVAVLVLLAGGIATTAILLANGDDGDEKAGDDPTSQTTSATSSPSESPTERPTEATSEGVPAPPTSPTGPITPYSPTDDTGDDIHTDVKAADFPGDWNFKLGDVEQHAKLRGSWDYDSCSQVEASSALTQQRCDYAVQWNFSALGGKARVVHLFLVFDTQPHAKAAAASLEDKDFDLRDGSLFADFKQGKWHKSTYGNVIAVTIGTTNATVPDKDLQSLVSYMNTDYRVALSFKGGF
ncbi:hypothetical protein [Nocardioides sp. LML1-1-1.1]|uniref:hypothetical protein n=1 Tax=Nocardioides sp. LML1-1-1.1 TaxID=3135248 RepID=UPI00342A9440